MKFKYCLSIGASMFAAVLPLSGGAAVINTCGPNVCYEYDDSQAAASALAFGQPTLVGDDMVFLPPSFLAQSADGAGFVTNTANFIFSRVYTVSSLAEIATFSVHEEFDYEIITDGEVRATLYTQARSNVVPTDGTSTTANFVATGDTGGNVIDSIDAWLAPGAAFTGPANDMQVGIQNTLRAYTSASGQLAFIQKKFTLAANTVMGPPDIVPVPGAVWLLGSGLGLLGLARRRAL